MSVRPFKVLFVCTGNICRSPTADAVMRHKVMQAGLGHLIEVDSAGTHSYHIGYPPDERSMEAALRLGRIDMSPLRARQVVAQDFYDFDWLVAMDEGHHSSLDRMMGSEERHRGRIFRFLSFLGKPEGDVPDPYYGGQDGFERVYNMVEAGCDAILAQIIKERGWK